MQTLVDSLFQRLEPSAVATLSRVQTPVAVACSGGADSIAAALIAQAICPTPITLFHFNHQLRGKESDADAKFVENFAKEIGVNFRLGKWEEPDAQNEIAARDARMAFLHSWEHETIVFGHHADDAAETLLLRLARGAAIDGLCAPHPVNRMRKHVHVRPLLNLRKNEILEALHACNISYRIDASNFEGDYLRNRIRNELLPLWQKIETRDVVEGILMSQRHLRAAHIASGDPEAWLAPSPSAPNAQPANSSEASAAQSAGAPPAQLPLNATLHFPGGFSLTAQTIFAPKPADLKTNSDPLRRVFIDANSTPLFVRTWQPGDRYEPLNSPGSRKVKEILNENCSAFSLAVRSQWPLIVDSRGNALWLPGARIAADAAIPPNATHAIELNFSPPASKLTPNDS